MRHVVFLTLIFGCVNVGTIENKADFDALPEANILMTDSSAQDCPSAPAGVLNDAGVEDVIEASLPPVVIPSQGYHINEKILVFVEHNTMDCQVVAIGEALNYYAQAWGYQGLDDIFNIHIVDTDGDSWNTVAGRTIRVMFQEYIEWDGEEKIALGGSSWIDRYNVDAWSGSVIVKAECLGTIHSKVYMHEFGHVFQLSHHENPYNIMYPSIYPDSTITSEQLNQAYEFARPHGE